MSSGERPIGAAKGKQSDTEALCQPPSPRCTCWLQHVSSSPQGAGATRVQFLPGPAFILTNGTKMLCPLFLALLFCK